MKTEGLTTWRTLSKPYAATIGQFDGLHLGHQAVLSQLKDIALERQFRTMVISFQRHTDEVLHPERNTQLLTTTNEKKKLLRLMGIDQYFQMNFTRSVSLCTARAFMEQYLQRQLHVKTLLIGYNHHFGHGAKETFEDYQRMGRDIGIEVIQAAEVQLNGAHISSTVIRQYIKEGKMAEATSLLGHPYFLYGSVVHGQQIGRTMGFPTANINISNHRKLLPKDGVYAVIVSKGKRRYKGVLNIGFRPTFNDLRGRTVEVHLLNYHEEIGPHTYLYIHFIERLRDECRFDDAVQLANQIRQDAMQAEALVDLSLPVSF